MKLCSNNMKSGAQKPELYRLIQHLADVLASQKKCAMDRQATENAAAIKAFAQNHVFALTEEVSGVKTAHAQNLHAWNTEV